MKKAESNILKRDLIIKKIRLVENATTEKKALNILNRYLEANHKNKSTERAFILTLLYQLTVPADIETIHGLVEKHFGHVSPTTVYYALQLFIDAKLARRIELIEGGPAFFEKTLDTIPCGYTICRDCGVVKTFTLEKIRDTVLKYPASKFLVDDVSLVIRGICRSCATKKSKEEKKLATEVRQSRIKAAGYNTGKKSHKKNI